MRQHTVTTNFEVEEPCVNFLSVVICVLKSSELQFLQSKDSEINSTFKIKLSEIILFSVKKCSVIRLENGICSFHSIAIIGNGGTSFAFC